MNRWPRDCDVANLTVVARLRGAKCRLPVFHRKYSAIIRGTAWENSPEKIPFTGKYCNPQPANCLKDQYVLRHCCVDDRSDKIGHSVVILTKPGFNTENDFIIPLLTQL